MTEKIGRARFDLESDGSRRQRGRCSLLHDKAFLERKVSYLQASRLMFMKRIHIFVDISVYLVLVPKQSQR